MGAHRAGEIEAVGLGIRRDHQARASRTGDPDGAQADRPAAGDQHAPTLDRLDEGGVHRVAHRLLERHDGGVEAVRLDRVRLRDHDPIGEPSVDVDADHAQVATEVHIAPPALGAGPVEEVALDADEVALAYASHPGARCDDAPASS